MAIENIQKINSTTATSVNREQATNAIVAKAMSLGIQVESYFIYDEEGNVKDIDLQKLNIAIKEAEQKENKNVEKQEETDEFVKGAANKNEVNAEIENKKAKESKETIDKDYNDAVAKYLSTINMDADKNTQEGHIAAEWQYMKEKEFRLTSADAANVTVLEGVRSFITNLTNLVNETKSFGAEKNSEKAKDSFFSTKTVNEIQNENNKIEAHETKYNENPFVNNPFYNSVLKSFAPEEEEEMSVD